MEARVGELEGLLGREQQVRLEAEATNRAKDKFLAMVAHELRAPLNAVLGWARVLESQKVDAEVYAHAVRVIERSARAQSQLIDDLLDTARMISGKLRLEVQPVDLAVVIGAAIDIVLPTAEAKGVAIEPELIARSEPITGDPDRLQQVVWNLLANAVKMTPRGGRIGVRLERVDPHVQLTVSDTGKGIRPEQLPYLFDRPYEVDNESARRQGGLGLGLSLVRQLVEMHGGSVGVESRGEGLGSVFTVKLPPRAVRPQRPWSLVPGPWSVANSPGPETSDRKLLAGMRVLIVDDEADARELVTILLRESGAEATSAASAAEALTLLRGAGPGSLPDVIISDIGMPGEDGYELIGRVRALAPERGGQVPAVALTAYGRADDRIRSLAAGFQMHVPKPVEPAELLMVVASLTGRAGKGRGG